MKSTLQELPAGNKDFPHNLDRRLNSRLSVLKRKILEADYEICIERARYYTEVFKETQGEHPSLRAAKALERTLNEMSIYILPEELLVGNRSSKLVGAVIPVERGEFNIILKMDLKNLVKREYKPFKISKEDKRELLKDILPYWEDKTVRHHKEMEWKANDLILNPSFSPIHIIKHFKNFGFKQTFKTLTPYIKGRVRYLRSALKEVALNNPNLVNNVMDTQGHLILGINNVLKVGFKGIKEKAIHLKKIMSENPEKIAFLDAVIITCDAVKRFAERFSNLAKEKASQELDETRKEELLKIAEITAKVPWNPPTSFHEAVQFTWFTQDIAIISYGIGGVIALGRTDQFLYPYYEKDLENGIITREFAVQLIEELLIKLSYNLFVLPNYGKQTASELGGDNQAVTIGGVNMDGIDATNPLSHVFLDAITNIKSMTNSFSIRLHSNSPGEYISKVTDVISKTSGPALFNDEIIIPSQVNSGMSLKDARDYGIIGCVEPSSCGNTHSCTSGNDISIVGILEMALNDGRLRMMGKRTGVKTGKARDFESFEQVKDAFKAQMKKQVEFIAECVNLKDKVYMERFHNPYISLTLEGCLENAMDFTGGGARYNFSSISGRGLATAADSLYTIKKAVFDEQWISMKELLKALDKNFRKNEPLRLKLKNKIVKYGNDNEEVDQMASWIAESFCNVVNAQTSIRKGTGFRPGFFSYGMNVYDGSFLGATPNGRLAGEPVSNSASPSNGSELNGPTAVIKSYSKLKQEKISNGSSLNLKISPSFFNTKQRKEKFVSLIKAFVKLKAMHMQFNVVDTKTLIEAQENPQNYLDLVVRVSGYSAYFNDLGRPVQDDIIDRCQFNSF